MSSVFGTHPNDAQTAAAVWAALDGRRSLTLDDIQLVSDVLAADACEYLNFLLRRGHVSMVGVRAASGGESTPLFRIEKGSPTDPPLEAPADLTTPHIPACDANDDEDLGASTVTETSDAIGEASAPVTQGVKGEWMDSPIRTRTRLRWAAEVFGDGWFTLDQLRDAVGPDVHIGEAAFRNAAAMLVNRGAFVRLGGEYKYVPTDVQVKARAFVRDQADTGKWFAAWMIEGMGAVSSSELRMALDMARLDGLKVEQSVTRTRAEGYCRKRYRIWRWTPGEVALRRLSQ